MEKVAEMNFFDKELKIKSNDRGLLNELDKKMKEPTNKTDNSRSYERDYKTCKDGIGAIRGYYHGQGKKTQTSFKGKILKIFAGCVVLGFIIYKFIA